MRAVPNTAMATDASATLTTWETSPGPLQNSGPSPSVPAAMRAWDLFGYRRSSWNDVTGAIAWDAFGFQVYNRGARNREIVVLTLSPHELARRDSLLMPGRVTGLMGLTNAWLTVHTSPRTSRIVFFGIHLLVTLRALRHWVSRWRRGVALLRKQHATMVFECFLPFVPEVQGLVQSFC